MLLFITFVNLKHIFCLLNSWQVSCNMCKKPIKASQFAAHAGEYLVGLGSVVSSIRYCSKILQWCLGFISGLSWA